jgi:hypothetical protein
MDLTPLVDQLRRELRLAADAGGDDARALAERLTAPLESSVRLALLSALSAAAEEITSQLAPGSVDLRLRGDDLGFVVTAPPAPVDDVAADDDRSARDRTDRGPIPPSDADDAATARITLRLPDSLKGRIDEAAARAGTSVNTWLVRALSEAVDNPARAGEDRRRGRWPGGQHFSGWVR